MDTWIVLANDDVGGHHRRGLYVLKSRGMAHSNELREFVLTDHGLDICDREWPHHGDGMRDASLEGPNRNLEHLRQDTYPAAALRRGPDAEVGPGASRT